MKGLKQLGDYLIWTIIAIDLGMVYMRLVLSFNSAVTDGTSQLSRIIHDVAVYHIGARIGGVIVLLFILLDVLVLKKKLKNNLKAIGIRLGVLLLITVIVGGVHYLLEKVIDVI